MIEHRLPMRRLECRPIVVLLVLLALSTTNCWPCCDAFTVKLHKTNIPSLSLVTLGRYPHLSSISGQTPEDHGRMTRRRHPLSSGAGLWMRRNRLEQYSWDGDDLRWWRRWSRRMKRRKGDHASAQARNSIMVVAIVLFLYQTYSTVDFIRRGYPSHWPSQAVPIITDAFVGSSIRGPLTMDFAFSNLLSRNQPHRFITSGLIHGGIFHLLLNIDALRRQPSWLETGLGRALYLTCMLLSIISGNIGHMYGTNGNPYDRTLSMGLSGGIAGAYGLMYVCMLKMGNPQALIRTAKGMGILFVMALFLENISNAAHFGGFLGGILVGVLCSPRYRKSYSMRRKNSVEYDPYPRDYRQSMGFGVMPTDRGLIPLPLLWAAIVVVLVAISAPNKFRAIPSLVMSGILQPGSQTP